MKDRPPKPYVIGITGGSASGKTYFLKRLMEAFSPEMLCLISQDHYYHPRDQQPTDKQGVKNFDTPMSIDIDQFVADIKSVKSGKTVKRSEYTFNNPDAQSAMLEFTPAPVIIVEGIFILYFPEVAELLDLKIFIDAKEYIKLRRRITRDQEERGYDVADVLYRYEQHVAPTFEKYILPFKDDADLIVPNNEHFEQALEVFTAFLRSKA
ncbi:MAG: uridine kinase family protein [Cyclobacteriaceae bacterium]